MTGLPYPVRLAGYGIRAPKTRVRGREVAGRVEATGPAVTALHVGDEVFGIADGSLAQYASARPGKLAPKPANLTFAQAAAVPVSALTALQAVRDRGRVQAGQKVLVIGASGGVGTFAVQIAKAAGAEVTGVSSTAKLDLVRSLGADHVIDYTRDDITASGHRYDVILDPGGHRPLSQLRRALTPRGTLVIVGSENGGRWLGGSDRQLRALMLSPFTSQTLTTLICSENAQDLQALTELIESGQVRPVIDRTYPLSQAPRPSSTCGTATPRARSSSTSEAQAATDSRQPAGTEAPPNPGGKTLTAAGADAIPVCPAGTAAADLAARRPVGVILSTSVSSARPGRYAIGPLGRQLGAALAGPDVRPVQLDRGRQIGPPLLTSRTASRTAAPGASRAAPCLAALARARLAGRGLHH
jgi:NADPH:quinone reductase-like Zn-dependent oxidoreductase